MTAPTVYMTDEVFRAYLTLAARDAAELHPVPCVTPGCGGTAYVHPTTMRDEFFDPHLLICDDCYHNQRPAGFDVTNCAEGEAVSDFIDDAWPTLADLVDETLGDYDAEQDLRSFDDTKEVA